MVIYDGLNLVDYIPHNGDGVRQEFGLSGVTPCVGVLGRLVEGKGYDVFIEAAARVVKRIPEAKFFIIGSSLTGAKSVENKARILVHHLDLSGHVYLRDGEMMHLGLWRCSMLWCSRRIFVKKEFRGSSWKGWL